MTDPNPGALTRATADATRYCATCEQQVSTPCDSLDCTTPERPWPRSVVLHKTTAHGPTTVPTLADPHEALASARRLLALLLRQPVGPATAGRLQPLAVGLPHALVQWAQKLGITPGAADPGPLPTRAADPAASIAGGAWPGLAPLARAVLFATTPENERAACQALARFVGDDFDAAMRGDAATLTGDGSGTALPPFDATIERTDGPAADPLATGRLHALQRGLALAREWANGTGTHGHTDTVVRTMAERLRVALASQPGDYDAATDRGARYYLQDSRGYVGNCPLWWCPDGAGYTTRLDHAATFTHAEALAQKRRRATDIPWPCAMIDALQRPTVDMQDLRRIPAAATAGVPA